MWAQYAQYADKEQGSCPRQLFLTKNRILRNEVKRSFRNMGLAWRKRTTDTKGADGTSTDQVNNIEQESKFLTSREWLSKLDAELPGQSFFTPLELEQRLDDQNQTVDAVTKEVEDLLTVTDTSIVGKDKSAIIRQEMTYVTFRKLWKKIRSGSGSQLDSTIVWREIKS